ncbi:MAG: hypothetical protein QXX12_01115 [Nanopusillaceae archaeon]
MPENFQRDRYGLIMFGPLSQRPAANSFRGAAVYLATDNDGNPYQVYIKPADGAGWYRVLGAHTHVFSDITGYLAAGYIGIATAPYQRIPSGGVVLWKHYIPYGLDIPGTVLEIDRIDIDITGRPPYNGPVGFTLKRNGATVCTVTFYQNQSRAGESFGPIQVTPGTDYLELVGPVQAYGALGLDVKIRIKRRKA